MAMNNRKCGGLLCRHTAKPVPLKSVTNSVTICDTLTSVKSTLLYNNDETTPIEAEFVFPLDDDSAVFQFEAELDGKHIVGECQAKDQAEESYKEALEQGHSAFLLKEDTTAGDIFCMKVGCLPPGKSATIQLAFVVKLNFDDEGAVQFVLPRTLYPRYTPSEEDHTASAQPSHHAATPMSCEVKFEAQIVGKLPVKDVVSESLPIQLKREGINQISVTLPERFQIKTDMDLRVIYDNPHQSTLTLALGDSGQTGLLQKDIFMLHFYPEPKASFLATKSEFIFVVDRSGSMRGFKMRQTKDTLTLFLKSLPIGCWFNIVSFGNNFSCLFSESREYNEKTLKDALSLINSMDADMGGTEIKKPLKHIFESMRMKEGYPRQLFILTDGMVSNTNDVISLIQHYSHLARVFAFGIGTGVSTALVKGMARAGKGKAEFVSGSDRLQPKVISCLKLASQPSASVSLKWATPDGITVTTIPDSLPVLFVGEHFVVYGAITTQKPQECYRGISAKLEAKFGDNMLEETVRFSEGTFLKYEDFLVHRVAGKTEIKHLELKDNDSHNNVANVKNKIVLLSLATNILSKHTAFFGVDTATKVRLGCSEMPQRSFSLLGPDMSVQCRRKGKSPMKKCSINAPTEAYRSEMFRNSNRGARGGRGGRGHPLGHKAFPTQSAFGHNAMATEPGFSGKAAKILILEDEFGAKSREEKGVDNTLQSIIVLQRFDGSWEMTEGLMELLQPTVTIPCPVNDGSVWATILVITWLKVRSKEKADEWELIAAKARTWLLQQVIEPPHSLETLAESAKKCL